MNPNKTFVVAFIAILIVYICGLPIDTMEVDAAQYATISYEMFENGDYLQLYCRGYDYLDKPPLLFWANQIFFYIFGVHDWSFKLANLVFIILGIYSTCELGKFLYGRYAGFLSAIVLASTQAWFLISHDVKTDGILASTIIFSVLQWKLFTFNKEWRHLILLAVGISLSMLTKGPIGIMIPIIVMGSELLANKNLKMIFNLKYIIVIIIIAAALSPMLYGLYQQYDLHPGKTVTGGQVVDSGIKFYFWTQSFGRLTGESTWSNNTSIFYFLPEIAWAFLPWTIFLIQSIIYAFVTGLKKNIIPLAGFILPLIALSLSQFKLSHYIFVCFPFLALLVGNYLSTNRVSLLSRSLAFIIQIILLGGIIFLGYAFNINWGITAALVVASALVMIGIYKKSPIKIFVSTLAVGIGMNLFLNLFIYPTMLTYQSSSVAGKEYQKREPNKETPLYEVEIWTFGLEFYAGRTVGNSGNLIDFIHSKKKGYYWLYMPQKAYADLPKTNLQVLETIELKQFPVTRLKLDFILPNKRESIVSKVYLVKVYLPEDWKS